MFSRNSVVLCCCTLTTPSAPQPSRTLRVAGYRLASTGWLTALGTTVSPTLTSRSSRRRLDGGRGRRISFQVPQRPSRKAQGVGRASAGTHARLRPECSVHRRCQAQHLALCIGLAHLFGHDLGIETEPSNVRPSFVVTVLLSGHQSQRNLFAGEADLGGAASDCLFLGSFPYASSASLTLRTRSSGAIGF